MASPQQHASSIFGVGLRAAITAPVLAMVFVLTIGAGQDVQAQTFNVIHDFTGGGDGAGPEAGLIMDRAGNLYGTASGGGTGGNGTVFKLAHKGSGWLLNTLYSFAGGNDGAFPTASVTIGPNGSLYGTTANGGPGNGIVFNVKPSPAACKTALCPWTETVLYGFSGGSDGGVPFSPVVFDQAGNLYGTTYVGGSNNSGTVYKLVPSGGNWTESVLHNFTGGNDGSDPEAGVTFDNAGNLYGTTYYGGSGIYGTVFQLTPSGSAWTENILYNFQGEGPVGCCPSAGVIFDSAGNLYGAASVGGSRVGGSVFEMQPSGGNWVLTVLYSFQGNGTGPVSDLVMDAAGNLYGTLNTDGAYLYGSVFKLTPSSGGWTYTDLHDFTGGSDGAYPFSTVILDANGNLYGTASAGGIALSCSGPGCGVVWEITP
ncbi:MAG: choice-of-anchor tandem repeat GloVer-containing protein [Candidatus Korobacteraceae bacterium]